MLKTCSISFAKCRIIVHMRKSKGFTLVELLIVVAIISILVTIAIPIFAIQLEKAKEGTDISNMRNAYATISIDVISEETIDGKPVTSFSENNPMYYSLDGSLTTSRPKSYGKGTITNGETTYDACNDFVYDSSKDYTNSVIVVWYNNTGVHVHWDNLESKANDASITFDGKKFIIHEIPSTLSNDETYNIKTGNVYSYKGKIYIALSDVQMTQYYMPYPESDSGSYLYITPTNRIITTDNLNENKYINGSVAIGDIYNDGTNLYIRKYYYDPFAIESQTPSQNSSLWQLLY